MVVQTALLHAKNEMQSGGIIREQCTIGYKSSLRYEPSASQRPGLTLDCRVR